MSIPSFEETSNDIFSEFKVVLKNLKKIILMIAGTASEKL